MSVLFSLRQIVELLEKLKSKPQTIHVHLVTVTDATGISNSEQFFLNLPDETVLTVDRTSRVTLQRVQGLSPFEAAVEAGGIRLRPIMMITLTTICGMLPLAIGIGEGAALMQPLAIAVVGGLLVSSVLTLFVVPSLYLIINGFADKLKYWLTGVHPDDRLGYATEGVNGHPRTETPVEEKPAEHPPKETEGSVRSYE